MRRRGISLVEVLVAVVVLGVLVGLILTAIQKVRAAAVRTQSCNNLRQVVLGAVQLADRDGGTIKNLGPNDVPSRLQPNGTWHYTNPPGVELLYGKMLPWTLGYTPTWPAVFSEQSFKEFTEPIVPVYTSPADPSLHSPAYELLGPNIRSAGSYAANLQVFHNTLSLPAGVPDGQSNTIAFAERYCITLIQGWCEFQNWQFVCPASGPPPYRDGARRPGFADPGSSDVVPVRDGQGRTVASQPGRTFQVRPTVEEADGKVLQTPHPGGLPVALFDGSVRTLSPSIAESVFWGLVTPAGGEVAGDF